jgi:hypothetical protein
MDVNGRLRAARPQRKAGRAFAALSVAGKVESASEKLKCRPFAAQKLLTEFSAGRIRASSSAFICFITVALFSRRAMLQ